jgi:hypothetical protein
MVFLFMNTHYLLDLMFLLLVMFKSFSLASQDTVPTGLAFDSSGTKMFIVGNTGDAVYEYNIGTTAIPTGYQPVHTTASIDSTYWTDINSMTADQERR